MKLTLTTKLAARHCAYVMTLLLVSVLTACGGGNGSGGSALGGYVPPVPPVNNGAVTLKLTDATGAENNTIPAGGSLNVNATVVDPNGKPVANSLVTFSVTTGSGSGTLPVSSALTDSAGVVTVIIDAGLTIGAGTITADATVATFTVTNKVNFQTL